MIEAAKSRRGTNAAADLPDDAVAFVREVISHNDAAASCAQVRVDDVLKTLASDFGWLGGKDAFQAVCVRQLGRASFTRKS